MQAAPGWYPDPSGHPFERFFDGRSWTASTRAASAPTGGGTSGFSTAPLPPFSPSHAPHASYGFPTVPYGGASKWWQRKAVLIPSAVVAGLIVIGAVGAAVNPQQDNTTAGGDQTTISDSSASSKGSARAAAGVSLSASAPKRTTSSKSASGSDSTDSFVMPDETGSVLQDAQDHLQEVSANEFYFSDSHDLIDDRLQILDSNWIVCTQNIEPGARVSANDTVDFGVVKIGEDCP